MTAGRVIRSKDNPVFKRLVKLASSARHRREANQVVLEGTRLVSALLEHGGLPALLAIAESKAQAPEVVAVSRAVPADRVVVLSDALCGAVSDLATPPGVLAIAPPPRPRPPKGLPQLLVMLEDIQDPGNLGSILRTAAAAGADAALLSPGCADPWSLKVLRAAMGAHFTLTIHERADLLQAVRTFRGRVIATAAQARQSLFGLDLTGPLAFIIGNEGAGVSPLLREAAHAVAGLPMPGPMESLNVAAAAAVCLYERVRQTQAAPRNQ
ncbi:TrmH family RNA methyltransferase [Pelomicrobium methylotrophicum]|uniref:RNA methyltransferase n=1 Tax=Pelomicrobium methylotrophicum TaxID=2602750 RepID=A0A5C7F1J9_9PROT|nr:RNA methyltransferase [Pelomicrobium methylotrophicum]TXF13658.1 RNA methyltransferase [Pelomicrobium methylotrophicum]